LRVRFLLLFLFTIGLALQINAQQSTTISGTVVDAINQEPLPYVTIQAGSGRSGVRTDIDGRFFLDSKEPISSIRVSYVGFSTQVVQVNPQKHNDILVQLGETQSQLQEIRIKPQKYKKDNPAVDLIEQVFIHKDKNRKEGLAYYQYEKHEKLRFDLNGITDPYRKKWYFKKFKFVFDFCDTNRVNQKVALPFYFRERIVQSFYRGGINSEDSTKAKSIRREKLFAERQTAFDDGYDVDQDGISGFLNLMYADVDIYEPTITLLDKQFIGPLSGIATTFYRFYITDTVQIGSEKFADVFFAPKNKGDLAFMGNILVALDSTFAVRRVEMGISKDINLNWVSDLRIEQDFEFFGTGKDRRLMLTNDRVILDMKILKKRHGRSILATKTNTYRDYLLNTPLPDSLFAGKIEMLQDTGDVKKRSPEYWLSKRHEPLLEIEQDVATLIDTVKQTKIFKYLQQFFIVSSTGFYRVGRFEIGEIADLYSFNDIEGNRIQLSIRTQDKYFKRVRSQAYLGYGFLDRTYKFGASSTIAFKGAKPGRFPANQIKINYTQDLFYPGVGAKGGQTFINSLQRGGTDVLLLNKIIRLDHAKEYRKGFSYSINTQWREVTEAVLQDTQSIVSSPAKSIATEFGTWIRYAPNERFYQTRENRIAFNNKWPIFYFQYRTSVKGLLGGDYSYHRASLRIDKVFYLAPLGKARFSTEYSKIFGQVSYPFLDIPRANQTYFFDDFTFSLMNYLEFVSDQSLTIRINHDLEGFVLNRVPLIKKLKWREGFTFKAVYGNLSQKNRPTVANQLIPFPVNAAGQARTFSLGNTPYAEASVGIGNIFGLFRLDYVWRLTYLNQPSVSQTGIRLSTGINF
jgi:hypothetical protein